MDSRGIPTLKATAYLQDGNFGTASVPAGISTGTHEAFELRDADESRYGGLGVQKAIANVNGEISKILSGVEASDQRKIDNALNKLDGTGTKRRLGANTTLSVSLAVAVAEAKRGRLQLYEYLRKNVLGESNETYELPLLMTNVIEGGRHVDKGLDFQEFLVIPRGFQFFSEGYENIKKLIKSLEELAKQKKHDRSLGIEGGLALNLKSNEEAITLIKEAIDASGLSKERFAIALDVAANSVFKDGQYHVLDFEFPLGREEYYKFLTGLCKKHNLFSVEDPFEEDNWYAWTDFTKQVQSATLVIGDDLTTTNLARLETAISRNSLTGVIVKPNQIGTLTETLDFIKRAKEAGLKIVVSHRSGETQDNFISDLAVAVNAQFIKIGSPLQKERYSKFKRLLEIEKQLNKN